MALRIKRIIDGRTYNTETATELAGWSSYDSGKDDDVRRGEIGEVLYQTRHGAYFVVGYDDNRYGEDQEELPLSLKPLDPDEAQEWAEKRLPPEQVEALFGVMPEAGDTEAKLTVRMPESLRLRLAAAAESQKQSLNAWIVRCLETCSAPAKLGCD